MLRTRSAAGAAAVLTVAAGLGVRSAATGVVAKYAGDALYTVLVLALVVLVAPRLRPWAAAGWALGISWAVELFQLTGVPAALAAHPVVGTPARLVLGTSFNTPDLFWYGVGAAAGWAVLSRPWRRRRRERQSLGTVS
ncbi:DUF2809 domain-containing protein [Streptomyces sp. MUM 203J]|uniref:ribosomal maturation YjgA family protein n=1 Tax=Streptomyces sp. MUM 203J TaxID=2791990 RepID=UPI001F03BBB7|nr:DUF2809 domain-containing protein [Streptomyces sp. MUM 203J]MCH0538295.1 DUF2809 domain-containing protein [Streptomyces sp. MUM 203J]